MENHKKRAANNRTLTLAPDEEQVLAQSVRSDAAEPVDSIINADLNNVVADLPDGFADLIIIDPPYNLRMQFGETMFRTMHEQDYENYLRSWLPEVCRKLAPHGSLYICCDWKCTASVQRVLSENLTILNRITWQREKGRGAAANWKNGMEDIWFAVKDPKNYHFDLNAVKIKRQVRAPYRVNGKPKDWDETSEGNYRLTCPSNFWDDISIPFWSMPENTDHPTQKPEKLYAKLILASSRPGDIVLDPFMGSGTAAVTAKKLGRHYCGIEINREYCLWATKRLLLADADKSIQGYANGVFWERNSQPHNHTTS